MKKDKIRLYILQFFLILILLVSFFSNKLLINKISIAIFLLLYALFVRKIIRSSKNISIHSKEVEKYMAVFGLLYLALYYLIGLYIGYYNATYKFNFWVLYTQILPLIVIIISSEILRREFIHDKSKLSFISTILIGILIDLAIYTNLNSLSTIDGFLESLGYVFISSIASNILYNYISINFGIKPNIIYRLITTIYLYIIPITPDVSMYFKSFARIVYPILILLVLIDSYEKKGKILTIKNKKFRDILTVFMIVIVILFTMLISCKFKYGLIVIGSNSMINTLDKGDAVVYNSKYTDLKEGQVILYKKNNIIIVHRIIRIEETDGIKRIYTKGDSNVNADEGYRTNDDIIGIVNLRIKKIGLPTIWVNELFNS